MTTTSDISHALELERKRQGLTVTEIINRAGVSRAAVYRLLKGEDVQLTTLLAVTNMLGLDLIALRANVVRLVPETLSGSSIGPANPVIQTSIGRQDAPTGPLSAVAARAARLQGRLTKARP